MKKRKSNLLTFGILTTVAVFTWVLFEAWRILTQKELKNVPPGVIATFDPNLDKDALKEIEERKFFEESELVLLGRPKFASGSISAQSGVTPSEQTSQSAQ